MADNANTKSRRTTIIVWSMWIIALLPVVAVLLALLLAAVGAFGPMPTFKDLEDPKSNLATEIISEDGKLLGTFYVQNRSYVQYDELFSRDSTMHLTLDGQVVPPVVAALISTEDLRFRDHSGIDFRSLMRVGVKTIIFRGDQGGGSTITQQLAKNLFPRDTVSNRGRIARTTNIIKSKFKEWITAIKLEYNYTKEEIIAMYLNTVEYGSNSYGIKSAARTFFNKAPDELNIQESAMLVGVVNAPTRYSPVRNPESALKRRNLVLSRMRDAGALSAAQYDSIAALPIQLNFNPVSHNEGQATYFREMLRLVMTAKRPDSSQFSNDWDYEQAVKQYDENPLYGWCYKNRKADGEPYDIYRDGLKIYTTINSSMQEYAEAALVKHLAGEVQPKMDAQVKSSGKLFVNTTVEQGNNYVMRAMRDSERYRELKREGLSENEIFALFEEPCQMKVFTYKGVRDTVMTPRDSVLHHMQIMRASVVAIEPQSGHVKAYVGGPNFRFFKYDMAKQGKRQIGSTVKPFIYTFAIDHLGLNPCTMVPNLPVTLETGNGTAWSPKEAGTVEYDGVLHPLGWGLARSRNNYSAWIMKQAKQPAAVADFIHNMGVRSYIDPQYALCLGSFDSNVFEITSAYSTFANEGVYNEPIFVTRIEDRQGNVLANFSNRSQDAISKQTAYTMLQMMKRVITSGTGSKMVWKYGFRDMDIAGKTGTSNENVDAWFTCVTPKLVIGAWVGGDNKAVHLIRGGEGSAMALPIVGEFLTKVYADKQLGYSRDDKFVKPQSVTIYECPDNGSANSSAANDEDLFFE